MVCSVILKPIHIYYQKYIYNIY